MSQGSENVPVGESVVPEAAAAGERSAGAAVSGGAVSEEHTKPAKVTARGERRDFFSQAMRETLAPFAGLIERRINPFLAALEALPKDSPAGSGSAEEAPGPLEPHKMIMPEIPRFLRPPGAALPGEFETICSACGKCVEVCPAHAIHMDAYGYPVDIRPYIMPAIQPCVVCESLACMKNCPSGALKLVDRLKIRMGTARVNLDLCLREQSEEDCRKCLEACPIMEQGAGVEGPALVIQPQSGRVRVRRNACVGCGLCESVCPTNPQAITVMPFKAPVDPMIA